MHILEEVIQNSDNIIIRKILDFLKSFAGVKAWMGLPGVYPHIIPSCQRPLLANIFP